MTRTESDLIQALRMEMQVGFSTIQASITELTADHRSHIATHEERDKSSAASSDRIEKSAVTRRWVIGVLATSISVLVGSFSLALAVFRFVSG